MRPLPNCIRKQSLNIRVESQETALWLQPRIEEINRRYLLPAIEGALNEIELPDRHVRIARLKVDLGKLSPAELDSCLHERLYLRLCEALRETLPGPEQMPRPGVCVQSEAASRLESLEQYLLRGTLPFWNAGETGCSPEELLLEVAELAPDALVLMLHKCQAQSGVAERIARQFREPLLQRLFRLLEPKNAQLILDYVFDLKRIHEEDPVLPLGATEFSRLVWLVTLTYVLQEPGSQFNRRSFIKSLLAGIAEAEGLAYENILHTLYIGLERTGKKLPLHSSLPSIIWDLTRDLAEQTTEKFSASGNGDADSSNAPKDNLDEPRRLTIASHAYHANKDEEKLLEVLQGFLIRGEPPAWAKGAVAYTLQELLLRLAQEDPDGLVTSVRACGDQASVHERLVAQLDRPVLYQLLHLLEPHHAGLIIAYVIDMNQIQRAELLLPIAAEKFDSVLWTVVLAYVLHSPGSQFNRKTFVKRLLERVSCAEGLVYQEVISILYLGVKNTMKKLALRSSLPTVIQELAREAEPALAPHSTVLARPCINHQAEPPKAGSRARSEFFAASVAARLKLSPGHVEELSHDPGQETPRLWLLGRPDDAVIAAILNSVSHMQFREIQSLLRRWKHEIQARLTRAPQNVPAENLSLLMQVDLLQKMECHRPQLATARLALSTQKIFYSGMDAILENCLSALETFAPTGLGPFPPGFHFLTEKPGAWKSYAKRRRGQDRPCSPAFDNGPYSPQPAFLHQLIRYGGQGQPLWMRDHRSNPALLFSWSRNCPAAVVIPTLEPCRPSGRASAGLLMRAVSHAASSFCQRNKIQEWQMLESGPFRGLVVPQMNVLQFTIEAALSTGRLEAVIEKEPQEMRTLISGYIKDAQARRKCIAILPEASLAAFVRLLEPEKYRALLHTAEVLAAACSEVVWPLMPAFTRKFVWGFLFEFLAHESVTSRSPARMLCAFFEYAAEQAKNRTSDPARLPETGNKLLQSCVRLARSTGRSDLLSLLTRNRLRLRSFWSSSAISRKPPSGRVIPRQPAQRPIHGRTAFGMFRDSSESSGADAIYIKNAGLVLAGTFLPHLFESLDLLEGEADGRRSMGPGDAASRAVHLLQYLVDGSCCTPEPLLALNKIMCGLTVETPIDLEIEPQARERDLCDRLLQAMIANWSAISNTSVAGLRETFLQREGRLEHAADGWRLKIQRKTVDVLIDQISWSISVIYHRWMPEPLYVKW